MFYIPHFLDMFLKLDPSRRFKVLVGICFDGFAIMIVNQIPNVPKYLNEATVFMPVLLVLGTQNFQHLFHSILRSEPIPCRISSPENTAHVIKIVNVLDISACRGRKSTLTCAKSFLAVGLIYAPSGALGRGPLSLMTEFFRSPLPPLIAGLPE